MPNLKQLRHAKTSLGLDLPDSLLKQVNGIEPVTTRPKVLALFAEVEDKPTTEQIRQLIQVINFDPASQPEETVEDPEVSQPATEAIRIVNEVKVADRVIKPSSEQVAPVQEVETSTSPVAKISFVEDRELTLGDIKPCKEKTTIANAGPGTNDDFKSYFNIDLPQGQIDDIELSHDQSVIRLKWKKKHGGFSYVVVGSASDFPQDVRHGSYRWLTQEGEIVIPDTEARFFTIFAFKEKGALGIQIAQGLLVDDILELEAEAYENEVRLRWVRRSSDGVVKVARSAPNQKLQKPLTFSNYLPVPADALAFTDTNVSPGDTYEYRVFVEWQGPGGQIFETPGSRITETTPSKVPNVDNFTVAKSIGDTVEISYLPVIRGEVRVYQLKGLPSAELIAAKVSRAEFDVANLDAGEFKWLGTRIIGAPMQNGSKVIISAPMLPGQRDSRTYVAITVLGSKALITDVKVVQQVGDIEELKVIDRYDYVLLRVSPPAGASALDVWVLSENAEVGTSAPTRRVQIDDEYRRFGGVIFGDNIKGLDIARSLDGEPKKIVVRGVSSWDGADHLGEASEVSYPGRVEVHYRAVRLGRLTHKGSMPWYAYVFPWLRKRFVKKAAEENQTKDIAKFEVKLVGNRKVRQNTTIGVDHFVGTRFPIDKDDKSVLKFKPLSLTFTEESRLWMMENKEGKFETGLSREEAEKMVGNSREAKRQRAFRRSREKSGRFKAEQEKFTLYDANHFSRLLPVSNPSLTETIFSIDQTEYPISTSPAVDVELKVVIMGPKRSGKTTYVQALINYLSNQFAVQMRARLIAEGSDEYTLKKMQEMESFITQGNLPQATQSASPFVSGAGASSLTDPRKPMKFIFENGESVPIKKLHITDVAGEDMDRLETMRHYADSIAEADLVVFLVDPLQIRQVRVALAGKPLPQEGGADPFNVLLNLSEMMAERVDVTNPNQKFAVVISKFDGIEDLSGTPDNHMTGTITPGLAVTRDPMTNSQATTDKLADIQDNARVHNEALSILERLRAGDFVTLVKNKLPFAQYFVVSALGHSSYNDRMDSAGISSFRISDPIRWAAATAITEVPKRGFFASAEAKLSDAIKARDFGTADYPSIGPDPSSVPLFDQEQKEVAPELSRRERRKTPINQPVEKPVAAKTEAEELQPQVEEVTVPEEDPVVQEVPANEEAVAPEDASVTEVPESQELKDE